MKDHEFNFSTSQTITYDYTCFLSSIWSTVLKWKEDGTHSSCRSRLSERQTSLVRLESAIGVNDKEVYIGSQSNTDDKGA